MTLLKLVRPIQLMLWLTFSSRGANSFAFSPSTLNQIGRIGTGSFHRCRLKSTSCDQEIGISDVTDSYAADSLTSSEKGNMNTKKKEILRFGSDYMYTSQAFSMSEEYIDNLYNFFNNETIQHLLLSGGTNSTVEKIPYENVDLDLVSRWNQQVDIMKGLRPDIETDSIVKVKPPGIDLLTVSIVPTTTIGTKLIKVENDVGSILPEFQATLIEDEPRAIGPKFFVWLFNKITFGGDPDEVNNKNDNNDNIRRENAFLRFRVEMIESEQDNIIPNNTVEDDKKFVFVAESSMWLEFEFPKVLLRFFPIKKDKAEALCSNAILKALEKNMKPAMEAFCKEYMIYKASLE